MNPFKILLADGLPKRDADLEVRILQLFLKNSRKVNVNRLYMDQRRSAGTFKSKFVKMLGEGYYDIVHVCSHGTITRLDFQKTKKDDVSFKCTEFKDIDFECRLFFSTACETGKTNRYRANYFWEALGEKCNFFVGPTGDIKAENAIMFSFLFYYALFSMGRTRRLNARSIRWALQVAKNSVREWGWGARARDFKMWQS